MKKIYALILVLLVNYSLQAQDDPDLLGQWYLHYIESNGTIMYPPSDGADPSINFSILTPNPFDENVVGDGVCNSFFSHYELPNSETITINFLSQTLIFCDNNNQDMYEFLYFSILSTDPSNTFNYTIDLTNNTLTMIDLLGEKLVYGRQILSIKDNEGFSNSIKIYPNPAKSKLFISGASMNAKTTYTVYDLVGKTIISESLLQEDHIDVTALNTGVYFLKIKFDGKFSMKKFIKL